MKKLLVALLFTGFSMPAWAGLDDAQLDLDITEFSFEIFESSIKTYDQILLDIEQSPILSRARGFSRPTVR